MTNKQIPFSVIINEDGRSPIGITGRKNNAIWDSNAFTISSKAKKVDFVLVTAHNNRPIASLTLTRMDLNSSSSLGMNEWALNGPQMGLIRLNLKYFVLS